MHLPARSMKGAPRTLLERSVADLAAFGLTTSPSVLADIIGRWNA
jgi:hypothetical protein